MTKKPMYVKGIALSGDYVKNLTDKSFTIVSGRYVEGKNHDTGEPEEKLVLSAEVGGSVVEWYINKTSQKWMVACKGYDVNKWIGFTGELFVKEQRVGKYDKQVIYIVEK